MLTHINLYIYIILAHVNVHVCFGFFIPRLLRRKTWISACFMAWKEEALKARNLPLLPLIYHYYYVLIYNKYTHITHIYNYIYNIIIINRYIRSVMNIFVNLYVITIYYDLLSKPNLFIPCGMCRPYLLLYGPKILLRVISFQKVLRTEVEALPLDKC